MSLISLEIVTICCVDFNNGALQKVGVQKMKQNVKPFKITN